MSKQERISMSVIRRLPRYYRFLYDLKQNGISRISSEKLATQMGLTASQIRQDFNCFGGFGQQGYGYAVEQLHAEIGKILGVEKSTPTILIGAGNMGRTIATQIRFDTRGVKLIGIFDRKEDIIGTTIRDLTVQSDSEIKTFCENEHPKMAILCIPKTAAPAIVDTLIEHGVTAFWNFSHYDINVAHPDAIVENVHLGDSLQTLACRMN